MSLSTVSIRRPVLTIVAAIFIVLFGAIGFTQLGLREFPSVDPPIITVSTNYTGASADVMESQITEPIEESVNGIAGIKTLTSVSREGRSTVTAEFELDTDLEAAANDVRDRVSRATSALPPDTDPPVVRKADADAFPIIFLNVRNPEKSLLELSAIAANDLKERFQTIPGVSEVRIWGEKRYSMRLWMDPARLAAYGLTPLDVQRAVQEQNVELPSGRIEGDAIELSVRTVGRLSTPAEFERLILGSHESRLIRFSDVGYAELAPENDRSVLKREGVPMVGVVIVAQPGSNHIAIADEFYQRLKEVKRSLPEGYFLDIGFDTTGFIRDSIVEVTQTILLAFLLVALVIFFFLREWRTTLIPVVTVPVSLISSFFLMYLLGFTINVLTLLGLVLAIGLVVDDAIVILENIYAKIEKGMQPMQAAVEGQKEVFFAIISTTVTLVVVFLPIIFLQGLTGRLFREFGAVVAGSVVISSFLALTLAPMMSSRLLRKQKTHGWLYRFSEPHIESLRGLYARSLNAFLSQRWLAWPILLVAGGLAAFFFRELPSEMAPAEDRGGLIVFASAQEGANFEFMDRFMDEAVATIQQHVPERDALISVTSPGFGASSSVNSGFFRLTLVDAGERDRSQSEIARDLQGHLGKLNGARAFVNEDKALGRRGFGQAIQFVLQAPNFQRLEEVIPRFLQATNQRPEFVRPDANLKFNKPELRLEVNREKAQTLHVSVRDVASTLQAALAGSRYGYFIMGSKQYQVIGQVPRERRDEPLDLRSLFVRNARGELVQLDNIVTLSEESAPPQRFRHNRYISATISANLADGYVQADGIRAMREIAREVLGEDFRTDLAGESKDFEESASSLGYAFMLALVLVYLVLAAQFESFRAPFAVMMTVPLALTGATGTLWLFGGTLNIFSNIGLIMLIGLVTKNGILIVEFTNQRLDNGLSPLEAIKDASAARFRPILMTSLSTILGILPIALAIGAGSESRKPMGLAIIGGLTFSVLLTLYIIPAVYSFLLRKKMISEETLEERKPAGRPATVEV